MLSPADPRHEHEPPALFDVRFATLILQQLAFGFSFSTFFLLPTRALAEAIAELRRHCLTLEQAIHTRSS